MKLFYVPGACSLASHIMLHEVGETFEIEKVDTVVGKTETGLDYSNINPNGYVPSLAINGEEYLAEGVAILQYIADTHPDRAFSPKVGTIERARLQQFLNFASAELHKAWGPLFSANSTKEQLDAARANVSSKLAYLESVLADEREYLVADQFSVADAYTFVLANWANFKAIELSAWPYLADYVTRLAARPSIQEAMRAEGLIQ
ncbi:MAG: glutathione transferase GstA [Pseudomonadota bacterium]